MTSTIIKTAAAKPASQHIGAIGDRVRIDGVIRMMFGSKPTMHVIEDRDGNLFVCRRPALGSKPGVLVSLEATVEKHEIFRDAKRTVISAGKQLVVGDDHPFLAAR